MDRVVGLAALALLALANVVATWIALRNSYTERRQKLAQVLGVWFIPVLGAILIFAIYRKPEKPTGEYRESADPAWDDLANNQYVGRAINTHADDLP